MEEFVETFAALANVHRIKIFKLLLNPPRDRVGEEEFRERKLCVCSIVRCLGLGNSTVSHHLACLRRAGLIKCEKRGRWIYYFVDDEGVTRFKEMINKEM
jgi:ArsR family transcriptional regulator